jgi:hypothetical protein
MSLGERCSGLNEPYKGGKDDNCFGEN